MTIRLATPDDAAAIAAIYRPAVTESAISFELEAPDAAEMAARIERTLAFTPWVVHERDGEVVGYAYASRHRERAAYQWSVDVSAYVADRAQRQGVGRALYRVLFALLERQGFRNAFAGIALPNDASVGLHRAMGFTPVGLYPRVGYKHGRWHDVAWFGRALGATPAVDSDDPSPPRALPSCVNDAGFVSTLDTFR